MTAPTVQPLYGASAALSNAIQGLASSSTFIAGYESAVFDNSSTKYTEIEVAGQVTVGTAPGAGTYILIYVVVPINDTPVWPDVFDGTESGEALTSFGVGTGFLRSPAVTITVDSATSDRPYAWRFSIGQLLGYVPKKWALFTTHNTGVPLHTSGGNQLTYTTGYNDVIPTV